ncbi:MAG: VOC family protein [Gammaproteobacteria bacterium]|nr:VOC family protein [Gammaproteobacteria bacterium]
MSAPLSIERANTIVYCSRWQECVGFYRQGLGLSVVFENHWFVEFALNSASSLSIADARCATIESAQGRGFTVTLKVPDIHAARTALAARGLEPGRVERHPWGANVFYVRDPDGNRVEFWAD